MKFVNVVIGVGIAAYVAAIVHTILRLMGDPFVSGALSFALMVVCAACMLYGVLGWPFSIPAFTPGPRYKAWVSARTLVVREAQVGAIATICMIVQLSAGRPVTGFVIVAAVSFSVVRWGYIHHGEELFKLAPSTTE